ncbi:hypothetical protein AVEN_1887-1 [Araneus ventricosus]|uniref:Uncharacterized protein n=1 Tax=Araneus ventricosus TaxID=182803 RepID=A0A4Y2GA19_ARAVE|nr:hypothetical protein AVEN_1887-1 [Araneus ventricosus]
MYDATVSHAFSISLIDLEDCSLTVTSSSDKLSSITTCCETQCNFVSSSVVSPWLCSSTIDMIAIHLQDLDVGQRHNLIDYRLHKVVSHTPQCQILQHIPIKASSKKKSGFS